jgi:hypothetical protein
MMYTSGIIEVPLGAEQLLTSTGDKLFYSPCVMPLNVRAFAVTITTALATNPLLVTLEHRPTAGSDTGRTVVATLNVLVANGGQGKNVYKLALNKSVKPGEELVIKVGGTAPTAGAANFGILVEPSSETPANNTNMAATT